MLVGVRPWVVIGLEAIASRLEAIATLGHAGGPSLASGGWRPSLVVGRPSLLDLEAITCRLEENASLEAIASRLEAIAIRLEAIAAARLEAIASRLEAIASRVGGHR